MAGYIGTKASVVTPGAERKKVFSIAGTTTSLTGLVYTPGFVHVFHNGIRLVDGTDYTAATGTSITLTTAAENGDEVVVVSLGTFQVADAYTKAEADNRYVNLTGDTMTGALALPSGGLNVGSGQLEVDASGRVLIPSQPSFWAQLVSTYTPGVVTNYSIGTSNGFSISVVHNVGNHYNSSTGVFTAPVAGVYVFGINDLYYAGTGYVQSGIRINGGAVTAFKYTDATGTVYDAAGTTITASLAANDTAAFFVTSNNSGAFLHGGGYNNMFGYLLG